MATRRFINPAQPQTLLIAVYLLYFNSFLLLLAMLRAGAFPFVYLGLALGGAAAAYGIANERKWAYALGIAMAFLPFAFSFYRYGNPFAGGDILSLMFEIALVALLLHPQSRDYQRIWFK